MPEAQAAFALQGAPAARRPPVVPAAAPVVVPPVPVPLVPFAPVEALPVVVATPPELPPELAPDAPVVPVVPLDEPPQAARRVEPTISAKRLFMCKLLGSFVNPSRISGEAEPYAPNAGASSPHSGVFFNRVRTRATDPPGGIVERDAQSQK
jgi:hypothetical protein